MVVKGTTIESTDLGGPAYTSKLIRGDVIIEIDGKQVTESNVGQLLVGNDKPGRPVNITVAKGGPQVSCWQNVMNYLEKSFPT